ncbi:phosphoadenosine phosphosulfate reductase family protein [Pseudomonas sp. LJDD11]|uniref:phosphoadenosine phosphosulfate reductase family protein n=1 Tax=Pseudomonas sp. LJDD11 TaxID=2931984 RepID=UPI00211C1E67|nr:phosphoadenosine phosphosulfate reductase family protein [Pseudomonas sp. LJDD11]MCQ9423430.1 phosphoadenosine phosphosulfate reductase family protein [Pseudomonas sp. LJDD11]
MNPYRLRGKTVLSFSGGRTSAYMLRQVLDANEDRSDLLVLFANTGKEHPATLEFVRACAENWDVPIDWVEYRDAELGFAVVDFDTCSRNGEPFEAVIRKRKYLPNPVTRFCTVELKIRTMHRYLKHIGWTNEDGEWDQMVGLRADEQRRVSKIRARGTSTETRKEQMLMPLADAGVSVHDVGAFWLAQPFNLELPTVNGRTLEGNCDLCFLKPMNQVYSIIATDRAKGEWWAAMEAGTESTGMFAGDGARFRKDRPSYQQMIDYAELQYDLFAEVDEGIECFCGD